MQLKPLLTVFTLLILLLPSFALSARWTFSPRTSVQGEYTDNLYQSSNNQEDFLTTVSAGFTAGVTGQKGDLSLSYDPSYVSYREFDENNRWRHQAALNGNWDITKTTHFSFSDNFIHTEDPLPETDIDILRSDIPPEQRDLTIRRGRSPYNRNTARARLGHRFGERDEIFAEYRYTLLDNEENAFNEDSQTHTPSLGLIYWFSHNWGIDLSASYTKGEFDQANQFAGTPTSDSDQLRGQIQVNHQFSRKLLGYARYAHAKMDYAETLENDYWIYEPAIGLDFSVSKDLSLSFDVGYWLRDFDRKGIENADGFNLRADLTRTLRRGNYRIYAASGWDEVQSGNQNNGFSRFYMGGGTASYRFLRQLSGDISGLYRRDEYEDEIPQRDDDVIRAGAGLAWMPAPWISIRIGYTFSQIDSNIDINDYTDNRGTLTISLSPEQPYRWVR